MAKKRTSLEYSRLVFYYKSYVLAEFIILFAETLAFIALSFFVIYNPSSTFIIPQTKKIVNILTYL